MLEFTQFEKSYGSRRIFSIASCRLGQGVYWLQGPNGAGKTTLLRIVAGIISFRGDILLDGHSLRRDPVAYRRSVSWADAEPRYPPFLTGSDLLSFYLSVRKAGSSQAEDLVSALSMKTYISTRIGSWSDGMIKKLSLALAFLGAPSLIVLDEPLVTLDATSVQLLYEMIHLRRQKNCSFLFTSHQDIETSSLPIDKKILIRDQTIETLAI
ncbi:MAG TPA: ABC transporter ATP-binding protein [Puia sp.]|nr:ABC transporter ATP-binding protein [Puia sp.]